MTTEEKQESNIEYGRTNNIINMKESYITKTDFLNIINDLNFIAVKSCNLDLITGFKIIEDDKAIQPLYYSITIE